MFWTPLLALITLQLFLCQTVRMEQLFFLPSEITALEGSCLVIPCSFTVSLPLRDRSVAFTWCLWWFYGSELDECLVIYDNKDSTKVSPRYKGRTLLVGDLKYRNCTLQINNVTKEDTYNYYPLSEDKAGSSLSVTVFRTPERLKVTYPPTMTEGVPVAITCSVEHTCPAHPPSMAWDKIKRNVSTYHQELTDGIWRTVLLLTYTPAAAHHMEQFVCRATYPSGKSASRSITLSIQYSPKGVHAVLAKEPVEGHLMELSCVVKSSNPGETHFTWYKNKKVIEKQEGKTLKIERTAMDDAGDYHCVAHNVMGSSSSTAISVYVEHGFHRKRSHPGLWICIFLAAVVAVSIAVAVPAWRYIKNKKKGTTTGLTEVQQESRHDGDYVNVDNPYTALDRSQISPEYDCLRR